MSKILDLLARLWALLPEPVRKEPAAAVGALVAVLAFLGVQLTADDVALLGKVLVVLLPLLGAVLTRQAVTPTPTVEATTLHLRSELATDQHPGNPFHTLIAQPPLTGDELAALDQVADDPAGGGL